MFNNDSCWPVAIQIVHTSDLMWNKVEQNASLFLSGQSGRIIISFTFCDLLIEMSDEIVFFISLFLKLHSKGMESDRVTFDLYLLLSSPTFNGHQ